MSNLIIQEYQAKQIEDTLRMVSNTLESDKRETCLDRNVMQSWQMIKNVLDRKPETFVFYATGKNREENVKE